VGLDVPAAHAAGVVHLAVYDVRGRRVVALSSQPGPAGRRQFTWSLREPGAGRVSPGVYFVYAQLGDFRATRKVTVLR
jgi:hypothetical protein